MAELIDLDTSAANNTARFPENMQFRNVNDSARELEAMLARHLADTDGSITSGGSANAYTLTPNRTVASYTNRLRFAFTANHSNTGAPTLNVSSLGAKSIVDSTGAALLSGDIVSGYVVDVIYDTANGWFQMISQRGASPTDVGTGLKAGDIVVTADSSPKAGRIRLGEATQTFVPATYPELDAWLQAEGSPWGANTLPSAAGYFLRFAGTTATVDPDGPRTAGSTQNDAYKEHDHGAGTLDTNTTGGHSHDYNQRDVGIANAQGGGSNRFGDAGTTALSTTSEGAHNHNISGRTADSGGDETRGKNVAFHADIIASSSQGNVGIFSVNGTAYTFDSGTTDADPGSGRLRINNAALASATAMYISETGYHGEDLAAWIATWDDVSSSTVRATIKFYKVGAPANFAIYSITGANTDNGTYDTVALTHVDSAGSFSNGDPIGVQISRTGAQGSTGAPGGGISFSWNTGTADADPGSGNIRGDNATLSSVTTLYVSTTDSDSADVTTFLDSLDDSSSTVKGYLQLLESNTPSNYQLFQVTGVTTATGYRKIAVTHVSGNGSFSASDGLAMSFTRTGDVGATGSAGTDPGLLYTFSTTTTDADPGAGYLRANNANLSSATEIYIDDVDRSANNHEATILGWDDISNATTRGQLLISTPSDGAQVVFNITGASTDAAGYVKLAVTYSSGATSFANDADISIQFSPSGNDGAGAVDSVNGDTGAVTVKKLVDTNGVDAVLVGTTASAVNEVTVTNAATGNAPVIAATGDDANIDLNLNGKGTGNVVIGNSTGVDADIVTGTAGNDGYLAAWNADGDIVEGRRDAATTIQRFTSSGTYTKPAGLVRAKIIVVGGGGGAGGCPVTGTGTSSMGGGGGAGGLCIVTVEAADLGATETVTIGAAGTGGTGTNPGTAGGTSSMTVTGGSTATATGGSGGDYAPTATGNTSFTAGANAGVGSNGDINAGGSPGFPGVKTGTQAVGGNGGSGPYGAGGAGPRMLNDSADGVNGNGHGAGGGGPASEEHAAGGNKTGGAGTAGIVIVEEYY